MGEAGKTPTKGQEFRFLEIASDSGAGLGLFETVHVFKSGSRFSNYLQGATRRHHGTPLQEFLSVVAASRSKIEKQCHDYIEEFARRVLPPGVSGEEVSTAIGRFGIVAAGGEIATAHG